MIHQRTKDLIFNVTKFITRIFRPYYYIKFYSNSNLNLHLGSGKNIIEGFINIDGNPLIKNILYYDIRNKLPFKDQSVQYIFTSNVLEHFFPDEILLVLKDTYRCLKTDGILRIVVPDLEKAINAYVNKDYNFFNDYPVSYKSLGGRFSNFIFCDAQHRLSYDFSYLKELLNRAGFNLNSIKKMSFDLTELPNDVYAKLKPFEEQFAKSDLFIEVKK